MVLTDFSSTANTSNSVQKKRNSSPSISRGTVGEMSENCNYPVMYLHDKLNLIKSQIFSRFASRMCFVCNISVLCTNLGITGKKHEFLESLYSTARNIDFDMVEPKESEECSFNNIGMKTTFVVSVHFSL